MSNPTKMLLESNIKSAEVNLRRALEDLESAREKVARCQQEVAEERTRLVSWLEKQTAEKASRP